MLTREVYQKSDGSNWLQWSMPEAELFLTSKGRELIHEHPDVIGLVARYKRAVMLGRQAVPTTARKWLRNGSNADIYELSEGSDYVVKECSTTQSMFHALNRMDILKSIIDDGRVPRWIDMPTLYGLLCLSGGRGDYLLMQKVDAGITVADVLGVNNGETATSPLVASYLGRLTEGDVAEVSFRYRQARSILEQAIESYDRDPEDYLPDWDAGNVMVERLQTPVAGSHFMLWVIDQ